MGSGPSPVTVLWPSLSASAIYLSATPIELLRGLLQDNQIYPYLLNQILHYQRWNIFFHDEHAASSKSIITANWLLIIYQGYQTTRKWRIRDLRICFSECLILKSLKLCMQVV